jgi:uncharacterized protein YlaN (UPF0358 family)
MALDLLNLKPQPHRMNLDANELYSLIGGVFANRLIPGCTIGGAVRLTQFQNLHTMMKFAVDNPLVDVDQCFKKLRSDVQSDVSKMQPLFANEDYA